LNDDPEKEKQRGFTYIAYLACC